MALTFSDDTMDPELLKTIRVSIQQQKGTKRRVEIQMDLSHPIEQVWHLITDYDRLAHFIPNLVLCRQIGQTETAKHLELVGSCQILNLWFSLRLFLEAIESPPYQIDTHLMEGDLRSYVAKWQLEPNPDGSTTLFYQAEIVPKPGIPVALLERQMQRLLPVNFLAISQYLDQSIHSIHEL